MLSTFYGWIDTRPTWDDTGITVFAVLITSFIFSILMTKYAWLWAIIIGAGIGLFNVFLSANYGALIVMLFAFAGAYSGVVVKKLIFEKNSDKKVK